MAARRAVRSTRRDDEDERVEEPEDELAEEEPEDELAEEEPEDELAEEEPEEQPDRGRGRGAARGSRRKGVAPAKAGQLAMRQIAELTGKQTEGITGVERDEDGWIVGVEVVEDRRIPSSTDVLAIYETEVDSDGELVSYRRVRRYTRGHGDSESL